MAIPLSEAKKELGVTHQHLKRLEGNGDIPKFTYVKSKRGGKPIPHVKKSDIKTIKKILMAKGEDRRILLHQLGIKKIERCKACGSPIQKMP